MAERSKTVAGLSSVVRNLEEARRTADAAMSVTEDFFQSGYGNRDSSPALLGEGIRHAISIAARMGKAADTNKVFDFATTHEHLPLSGLTGIEFLLMMVPVLSAALVLAPANTTVRVTAEDVGRLDGALNDNRWRDYLWFNRRNSVHSHSGIGVALHASAPALSKSQTEAWLKGDYAPLAAVTPRGLASGIQKSHGMLGVALAPNASQFGLVLVLPT